MTAYRITRDIDKREQPWMEIRAGEIVYAYTGCTYGCIGAGLAVSRRRGEMPFFEVPKDAIESIRRRGLLDQLSGKLRTHARDDAKSSAHDCASGGPWFEATRRYQCALSRSGHLLQHRNRSAISAAKVSPH